MTDVAIIGGGIAGLAAARTLRKEGFRCTVFEKQGRVGGSVASEKLGDITVDKGFQVFNSWFPAVKEILRPGEYAALRIKNFQPGIQTLTEDGPALIVDPVRAPAMVPKLIRSKLTSALSVREMLRLQVWMSSEFTHRSSLELRQERPRRKGSDQPISEALDSARVTGRLRTVALDPLIRAFLYDTDGQTSGEFAKWVIMTLLRGTLAIPENGMADLPIAMSRVPGARIALNCEVHKIEPTNSGVKIHSSEGSEDFRYAVLAVPADVETALIGTPQRDYRGASTWWFASGLGEVYDRDSSEFNADPVVTIDGADKAYFDSAAELTSVAPAYAPDRHLVAATKVHTRTSGSFDAAKDLPSEEDIRRSLARVYGPAVLNWDVVARHDLQRALPVIRANEALSRDRDTELLDGRIALAGVQHATPSVDGAIRSGQKAARLILARLQD